MSIVRLVSNEGQLRDRFCRIIETFSGPVYSVSRSCLTTRPPQVGSVNAYVRFASDKR